MARTLEQKIADAQARLDRLRERSRRMENGQKIILGGMLITAARKDHRIREWLLAEAARSVTRDVDKKRLEPLLNELRNLSNQKRETTTSKTPNIASTGQPIA